MEWLGWVVAPLRWAAGYVALTLVLSSPILINFLCKVTEKWPAHL
jgi:hypothetical protein